VEHKDIERPEPVIGSGGFASSFLHALDPKKRLTIPSVWRAEVGEPKSLYVLPGLNDEKCLYIYPAREMARRLDRFRKIGIADKKARVFARILASRSDLVAWDSQGRIRIKDELLDYAKITGQVKLVGAFDRFELWNPQQWQETTSAVDSATLEDALRYVEF
jgi:MraZ protein